MTGGFYDQYLVICEEVWLLVKGNEALSASETYNAYLSQETLLNTAFAHHRTVTEEMVATLRRLADAVKQLDHHIKTNSASE